MGIHVTDLVTYPVKSCRGVHLCEARTTVRGLELDRDYMLVDDQNDFVSQRKVPELALVVPTIGERSITLSAPGMSDIELALDVEANDERAIVATVHRRVVTAQLMGEELDEWFTTFLSSYRKSRRFRLVRVREDRPGSINERYQRADASNRVGFADGYAMLLATEPSLAQLNALLERSVPMSRFRPNVVLAGSSLPPYEEDHWMRIRIGEMHAFVVKGCDRCVIPDIDQQTAITYKDVRRALRSRKGVGALDATNKGVFFAQNLNHVFAPGQMLRIGDRVQVIERSDQPNVVIERPPSR